MEPVQPAASAAPPPPPPPPPEVEIKEGTETPPAAIIETREQVAAMGAAGPMVEEGRGEKDRPREEEEEGGVYACV